MGTAHASDSFITQPTRSGDLKPIEDQRTKLVAVTHFRGILAYWALAQSKTHHWSTHDWLIKHAQAASSWANAESFAQGLAGELQKELEGMRMSRDVQGGPEYISRPTSE